jgi:tyrosyl-DNA phosphodiesterase-1
MVVVLYYSTLLVFAAIISIANSFSVTFRLRSMSSSPISYITKNNNNAQTSSAARSESAAAAPVTKKRRLAHLNTNDGDSSSEDDFEVMRQKLREMQNGKVKELEKRRRHHDDAPHRHHDDTSLSSRTSSRIATTAASSSSDTGTMSTERSQSAASNKKQSAAAAISGRKQEVIDLLDESSEDNEDDNDPVPKNDRKRKALPSLEDEVKSMGIGAIKRELEESFGIATNLFIEKSDLVCALIQARSEKKRMNIVKKQQQHDDIIPFHLFATSSLKTLLPRQTRNKYFRTLRQIIGFDVPNRELKWLIISNFSIDFGYLLDEILPDVLQFHRVVVFYHGGINESAVMKWRELLVGSGNTVDFVALSPSDPPNSTANPLPVQIDYGLHHTKMFLTGYDEVIDGKRQSFIRVAIHTSNLLEGDNQLKANGVYAQNFPLKEQTQGRAMQNDYKRMKSDDATCLFEEDLCRYVKSYGYTKRQRWTCPTVGVQSDSSRTLSNGEFSLAELIRLYDYSSAYAVLIPSVPGRHKSDTYHNFGYLKLRKAIMDSFPAARQAVGKGKKPPVMCQVSSLGKLNTKWLSKFHEAIDYITTHSARPVEDYHAKFSKKNVVLERNLRIVWPTAAEIRNSVEGHRGGGSVMGKAKNVQDEFLQPLYHRWSSRNNADDPLQTARHVPHIKTLVQPSSDRSSIEWLYLGSHNLSIAAWGQVQARYTGSDELILRIAHWELGVFISPATLAKARGDGKRVRIVPFGHYGKTSNGAICLDSDDDEDDEGIDVHVPLPYSLHTPAYDSKDVHWTNG